MSVAFDRMKYSVSETISQWYNSLDMFGNNIVMLIAIGILGIVSLYLLILYVLISRQLNEIKDYVIYMPKLGKVYSASSFDPILFERLLLDAIRELQTHVDIVSAPYFYSKSLEDMLSLFPSYDVVLKFTKYVNEHSDIRTDAVHKVLVKNFGKQYKKSNQLVFDVTIQVSPYRSSTYKHSILVDLTKSQIIYRKNKTKANEVIAKRDAVEQEKQLAKQVQQETSTKIPAK